MFRFPRPSSAVPAGRGLPPRAVHRSGACGSPGTQQRMLDGLPSWTVCSGGSTRGLFTAAIWQIPFPISHLNIFSRSLTSNVTGCDCSICPVSGSIDEQMYCWACSCATASNTKCPSRSTAPAGRDPPLAGAQLKCALGSLGTQQRKRAGWPRSTRW